MISRSLTLPVLPLGTQIRPSNHLVLGLLDIDSPEKLQLKTTVLKKQTDGLFDVDGSMAYESHTKNCYIPILTEIRQLS